MGKRSGGFKLESIYDPKKPEYDPEKKSGSSDSSQSSEDGIDPTLEQLETKAQRKKRYWSIGITCISGFTFNIAFSLVLTSAYPYLEQMQGQEEGLKSFLGWVVAAQPLAQLFFSPLMGFLGNKFGTVRYLMMITMVILTGGFIFYACIGALPCPRKFYLVIGRLIIGAAAGTTTLCFSYVAGATTVDERTKAFGLFSFAMASAFVLGPVIQSAFVTLGEVGYYMGVEGLYFNVYTGPSWLAALLAMLNLILYVPCLPIFKEYYIAEKEGKLEAAKAKAKDPDAAVKKMRKPDMVAIVVLLIISAFVQFNFIFLETLLTPMTLDFLAWTEDEAILYVGLAFAGGGLYSGLMYGVIGFLSRKLSERIVLIAGLVLLILGPIIYLPFGSTYPPRQWNVTDTNKTDTGETFLAIPEPGYLYRLSEAYHLYDTFDLNGKEGVVACSEQSKWNPQSFSVAYPTEDRLLQGKASLDDLELACEETDSCGDGFYGCPMSQLWCNDTVRTEPAQMIVGFLLICTGYPLGLALSNSIFSKVLGPIPQGTWMGILAAGGCLARFLCPICVSYFYDSFGTWAAFGFMIGIMTLVLVLTLVAYRRLVPYKVAETQGD